MKLLVTGANGFVGRAILQRCAISEDFKLFGAVRSSSRAVIPLVDKLVVGDLSAGTEWGTQLEGMEFVVHAAARAHILRGAMGAPLDEFQRVNCEVTLNLARECARAGVRRFVFISSIGVNGRETFGVPFSSCDEPRPSTPYALSKAQAETGLWEIAEQTGLEVVIIRPPLIYGAGAPGNFGEMLRWLKAGIPLPFGAIDNQRSLVGIGNLVDLVITCIKHPNAGGRLFLVSDDMDVSTTELLRLIGQATDIPVRLFSVPKELLRVGFNLVGMKNTARQLLGSLQVDIADTKSTLNWKPKLALIEGLKRLAENK
jgi:nucleoside-diphosphate-sugar epimerase